MDTPSRTRLARICPMTSTSGCSSNRISRGDSKRPTARNSKTRRSSKSGSRVSMSICKALIRTCHSNNQDKALEETPPISRGEPEGSGETRARAKREAWMEDLQ